MGSRLQGGRSVDHWVQGRGAHLCSPSAVDEGTDGLVGPGAAGVQVRPVPGLDQTYKVGALPLVARARRTSPVAQDH